MPRRGGSNLKKAPGTAVDVRNGQKSLLPQKKVEKWPAPAGISPKSVEVWDSYWDDPISGLLTPSDMTVLNRWIEMVDQRDKLLKEATATPIVLGSTRQKQAHPMFALSLSFERAIEALEAQLGIGPKNRAALGIAVIGVGKGLDDFNSGFEDPGHSDDDEDDPRIVEAEVMEND